jgi:cellulose synthase/poly-beta-1,6-N-acetylglucosamine synthase-like glycosyltransferase
MIIQSSLPRRPDKIIVPRRLRRRDHPGSALDNYRKPLGQILMDIGALSPHDMITAAALRRRQDTSFADILLAHDMVIQVALDCALSLKYSAEIADFNLFPAEGALIERYGAARCLRDNVLPWRRVGSVTVIACCDPGMFREIQPRLRQCFGACIMAVTSTTGLHQELIRLRPYTLVQRAETRIPAHESCRDRALVPLIAFLTAAALLYGVYSLTSASAVFSALTIFAILVLILNSGLKIAAAVSQLLVRKSLEDQDLQRWPPPPLGRLPTVSVLIPLLREENITDHLLARLLDLSYPKELLDICLVIEDDDTLTRATLSAATLPYWMRQIIVPRGKLKTKPRALNYALDFCRGSIIGIYDAEDAPAPDQIHKIVRRFRSRGPEVGCLQGVLDFYNSRTNWLSRCFTIEYAAWFRLILPGMQRLGLVVPLGGTTVFFRREALERAGCWDAHNVTEDADLGIRLARHGFHTEFVNTVTHEEANCAAGPWIRQRSRWLKGYAMTWAVHMRNPRKLMRDLGPWRFLGVQVLLIGTPLQLLLTPLMWSFWAIPLGLPHPLQAQLSPTAFTWLAGIFLTSEALNLGCQVLALRRRQHQGLWKWVPTMHFYYPLGVLAVLRGLISMIFKPYYWDKTAHGVAMPEEPAASRHH